MGNIKGIAVTLYNKVQTGTDEFNAPIYKETPVTVENVLVTPTNDTDVINDVQLYGKRADYELSIPKGDTHEWMDRKVEIKGEIYKTLGYGREWIESMVPLDWNKKVKVAKYG